jgi:hypothetical protein
MKGIGTTHEDIAAYLEEHGERYMAVMVRTQTEQLQRARAAAEQNLRRVYELRDKYEPRTHYVPPNYRSPPESDG